jgi:hypothetical protein
MRTKLLLGVAALAVSAVSSMAQANVYSLNIVGYANVPNPIGYTFQTTPFRANPTNNAANLVLPANTGQYDGDQILIWQGLSWQINTLDSASPSGFSDFGGNPVPAPLLNSGVGYLYANNQGVSNNITYVGEVRTGTNVTSITAPPEFRAVGSPAPLAGGVSTVLQLTNPGGVNDGDAVQTMVRTAGGAVKGFSPANFDSAAGTGFSDAGGNPIPEPQIAVGQGFFYDNVNAHTVTWTQILNP